MIAAVTGASGFIGRRLSLALAARGWDVRSIVRRPAVEIDRMDGPGATDRASGPRWLPIDYAEPAMLADAVSGADVVFHAAGVTRASRPRDFEVANVDLTRRVASAAAAGGVGRFVLISSQAASGPANARISPVTEGMIPGPIDAYGRSKLEAERVVAARELVGTLPFTILRPAAVYGPGDRDFREMFRLARRGVALHPGNRDRWISIIHVTDLVDGIIRAGTGSTARNRAYFLANDEPVQWGQLFRMAAAVAGRALALDVNIPQRLVDVAAHVGNLHGRISGRATLLTTEKVRLSKPSFWICSSALARRELGFAPAIGLEEGLRETYQWYVETGWL
jgi:nucleoside-diphosphate-sugar epimerase